MVGGSGTCRGFLRALIAAAALAGMVPAPAQELSAGPVFALNTPWHAGFVLRVAVTPDERRVVTAGFDKTIRVWDAGTGQELRRFFLPVRDAGDGRVTALALSPDGERLAVGGGLSGFGKGKAVLVVSLADGRIGHVLGGFNQSARTVAWSKDGGLLAVGMDGHEGPSRVHVFETATWDRVFDDRDIRGRVDAIEFRRDGAFVAVTNNGTIDSEAFLYRPSGKTFQRVAKRSFGVRGAMRAAWSADETRLYVGGHGYLAGDDLADAARPGGINRAPSVEGFAALRESPDGARVYAASWGRTAETGRLRRYRDRSLRYYDELVIPDARVADFAVLRDGTLVYVSQEGAVAAIGPDFKPLWRQAARAPWLRGSPERLKVSTDGRWVALPLPRDAKDGEIAFNLYEPRFERMANLATEWVEPVTSRPGVQVLAWKDSYRGTVNGNPLPRHHGRETALSVAVHSAEPGLVYGSSLGRLRRVSADGKAVWMRPLAGDISAVHLIEAAGLVLAATEDGFLRAIRWADGATVMSYFLQPAERRWIAVSDGGYFESGVGAEDLAGWIVNRGTGQTADFYPLSRFREQFLLPGVAGQALQARDGVKGVERALAAQARLSGQRREEAEARVEAMRRADMTQRAQAARPEASLAPDADPEEADQAPGLAQPIGPAPDRLPPIVDILGPGAAATVGEPRLLLRLRVRSPAGAPVTALSTRVVSAGQLTRGLSPAPGAGEQTLAVDLPEEDAEVYVVAVNRWGSSVPAVVRVRYAGKPPAARGKGVLHVLAVGVSDYDNPGYRLGLAAKDARDFGRLAAGQQGRRYDRVESTVLTDKAAGKQAVERALAELRGKVGPRDTTFVFLAGHGINDEAGEYLYLPREADLARLAATGVSFRLMRQILTSLPGRTLLFVDTCHAGNALGDPRIGLSRDNTAAINDLASVENNIIVFASSTGAQESVEDAAWGNGAFTKALIEGLAGAADFKRKGRVTYKQLDAYVADRVEELTRGRQTPVTPVLLSVPDFVLAETGP
jgi:hypothetical protein